MSAKDQLRSSELFWRDDRRPGLHTQGLWASHFEERREALPSLLTTPGIFRYECRPSTMACFPTTPGCMRS